MSSEVVTHPAEKLAQEIFDLVHQLLLLCGRGSQRLGELTESEFLTLAILGQKGQMGVSDLQRQLRVLPAQMSRILRRLESRRQPLVECRINMEDRRKVDVRLTEEGERIFRQHRLDRLRSLIERLHQLTDADLEELATTVARLRGLLERRSVPAKP
ncbi:MAG: hypothetical protein C4297_08540 [Gemmataceae bacterium]